MTKTLQSLIKCLAVFLIGILNLDHWNLSFDLAQDGELVEPFEIWFLVLGIFIENTTKAPRHKSKPLINIHLCVWWRKCFATICTDFTIERLAAYDHRNQKNFRVIRDGSLVKIGSRDIFVIYAHDSVGMRIIDFVEQIADGHPFMPDYGFI